MWYFGTNLESRFSVPDFWPEPGTTHKIPFEREELKELSEQLKAQRLERRRKRSELEKVEMREKEVPKVDEKVDEVVRKQSEERGGSLEEKLGIGTVRRWVWGK